MNPFWRLAGLVILLRVCAESFNLDPESAIIVSSSDMTGYHSTNISSYFGFSSLLYMENNQPWLLVGAPKANASVSSPGVDCPGAVYKCPLSDGALRKDLCSELQMDYEGRGPLSEHLHEPYTPYKSNQWFGVSMDSSDASGWRFVACGHLRKNTIDKDISNCGNTTKRCYRVTGACFARVNLHDNTATPVYRPPSINEVVANYPNRPYMLHPEAGTSVHLSTEGDIIMGAPGSLEWQGGIIYKHRNERKTCLIVQSIKGASGSYIGYSVTSLSLYPSKQTIIASGAPRYNDSGKVYIFANENKANCDGWKVSQHLDNHEAESLGSYFGASILAADVDGDGFEELFVGAPLQNLSRGDEGAVYCYASDKNSASGKFVLVKRLTGSEQPWSRFGTSMALAGDVNLDGFNDIIVGAPYEDNGSGAIYLYLGGKAGIMTPFKQRISASRFNPDLKTFGHTIGRGQDIDGNGYPDIAVGAFLSDSVFVLRPRPVHSVRAKIWFPVSAIDWNRASLKNRQSFEVELTVSFFYTIPQQETRNIKDVFILRNYLNRSASQDIKQSIAFKDSPKNPIQFLIVPCHSGENHCVSLKVADRPNVYLRHANNSVYLDDLYTASNIKSFHRETSFRLNPSLAPNTPRTIESCSQPRSYLRSEDGMSLTVFNFESGTFPGDAFFTFVARKYLPCIKGLTYDLTVYDDAVREGPLLLNRENNSVQTVRETIDFTVENIDQTIKRSWTVTFQMKDPWYICMPLKFRLNMSGASIGENKMQAMHSDRLRFVQQSVILNDTSIKEFYEEIGFRSEYNSSDICTPKFSIDISQANSDPWIVGTSSSLNLIILSVHMRNVGEFAQPVGLQIEHPSILHYKGISAEDEINEIANTEHDNNYSSQGLCNGTESTGKASFAIKDQIQPNGSLAFNVSFESMTIANVSDFPINALEFFAHVTTPWMIQENVMNFSIPAQYVASLKTFGAPDDEKEYVEGRSIVYQYDGWRRCCTPAYVTLEHKYDIRNTGPGLMPSVVVDVLLPRDSTGEILAMNVTHVSSSETREIIGTVTNATMPLPSPDVSSRDGAQHQMCATTKTNAEADDLNCTLTISCETRVCSTTRFEIGSLLLGDSVEIHIRIKVLAARLPKDEILGQFAYASIVKVSPDTIETTVREWRQVHTKISTRTAKVTSRIKRITVTFTPSWLVVLCLVIGSVLFGVAIYFLWQLGFFERKDYRRQLLKAKLQRDSPVVYKTLIVDGTDGKQNATSQRVNSAVPMDDECS